MDIFERIRQIITPSNIKQPTPTPSSSKGIEAVNQIRSSLNLPAKPVSSQFTPTFNLPSPIDTKRFEPRIPTTPQPQMSRLPQIKPQQVMSVKPPEPKAIPFQTFTPRVPEAETPFGKFIVSKGVLPLNTGLTKLSDAWKNTDNKGGLERTLQGVEGVGLIATIPNEVFIQPVWDSIKLGIKGLRTGKVTQDDIDNFLFTSGGQKGTIFEAFGTNEDEFGKQYGDVALGVARFADFAPELINVPGSQAGKGAKTMTLAREVKVTGKGAKELGEQASKAKKVEDTIKQFEVKTGKALDNATKNEIKKTVQNPQPFLNKLQQKAPKTEDLVSEARKYKTPEEFIQTQGIFAYHGTPQKFEKFTIETVGKSTDSGMFGKGIYFTENLDEARTYSIRDGKVGEVKEVYLKFKNPYIINSKNDIPKIDVPTKTIEDLKNADKKYSELFTKYLQDRGFDGVIDNLSSTKQYVVFNPEQIKTKKELLNIWNNAQKTIAKDTPKLTTNIENVLKSVKKGAATGTSEGANLGAKIISGAQKERRFAKTTVAGAERTPKALKKILDDSNDLYNPLNNKVEFAKAERFVETNSVDDVLNRIRSTSDTREVSYLGQALMNKFQKIGDYASEGQLALEISKKGTEFGQAIQALSIWKKLSPTGAKVWAQKLANDANTASKAVAGDKNFVQFTEQELKAIGKQAEKIGKASTEYDKAVQTQLLAKLISAKLPTDFLSKVGTIQTMAQLINPKTLVRNVAGNMIFGVFEAVSNGIATPIDLAVSLFTKKRGVANLNPVGYAKGFAQGFGRGVKESLLGIDTLGNSSLEQGVKNGFIFQSKVMQGFEKTLNLVLKPFDRAFYEANYRATLEGLMKANKVDKPTQEMIEQAHYMGLYRTFQDDNVATKVFGNLKKAMNTSYDPKTKKIVVNPFGLGDLVLKYTKVPANIIMRAVDYSPIGYVKAVMELAQPLFKREFNQAEFVNAIARASVGTLGVMNTGYILGKLGIITPKPDSSKDVRNAQQLDGVRSYAINTSALKRYVASGFDPESAKQMEGDTLVSYDWAQPVSIPLAMGANWAETEKLKKNSAQERILASFGAGGVAFADAMNTLTEQPLLQGLKTTFSPQGLVQGLINTVKGAPASFVPTVLNQINQLTDNTRRETFSPNILEESKNLAINKVPFLSQSLPVKYDILGKPLEKYQGGTNTFANVMINPAFVSKVGSDENLKEVIRLYETLDDTGVIPNTVTNKVKINKEDVILTGEQMSMYQKEIGSKSDEYIRKLLSNEDYYKLPDDAKASLLAKGLSNINSATKINMFGDRPETISQDVALLRDNQMDNYVYKNVTDAILDQPKKEMSVKTDQLEILLKGQRNPEEISKFIIENKIPQSSISGVINKIAKDEVFKQLSPELQKYNGLSNSQLEELKTLKPQLTTEIIQYQSQAKVFDTIADAQIGFYKNLGTNKPRASTGRRRTGRIARARIKKPRKPSLKLAKIKGIKTPKTRQIKLAKIKKPKPLKLA
jgi:hypothetical protein